LRDSAGAVIEEARRIAVDPVGLGGA